MKVLLVDPDPRTRVTLERVLKEEFAIDSSSCAVEAKELLLGAHYDLVLTEMFLPDMDGGDFINLVRSIEDEIPVFIISNKFTVADKSMAFENGADDYVQKPFSSIELKARIKAVLRRTLSSVGVKMMKSFQCRELVLHSERKLVLHKNKRVPLRKKEFQLLEYLMQKKNRVVTRSEILDNLWESSSSPFTNTVEVHLKRVRDKIEKPFGEKFIETIHGFGYMFVNEDEKIE